MKGHFTLLFTLMILSSLAQIKEKHVEEFDPNTGKRPVFSLQTFYDKGGNVTEIVQKTLDRYGEYLTITSTYEFDAVGKRTSLVVKETRNGSPEKKAFYKYLYLDTGFEEIGEYGKLVTVLGKNKTPLREEYYDNSGGLKSETEYKYDEKNRLVKKETRQIHAKDNYFLLIHNYNDALNQRVEHFEYATVDSVKTVKDCLTDLRDDKPTKTVCLTNNTTQTFTYDKFDNEIDAKTLDSKGKLKSHRRTRYRYW